MRHALRLCLLVTEDSNVVKMHFHPTDDAILGNESLAVVA